MRISHSSYSRYISELNSLLAGKELFSPLLMNNETIVFPLQDNSRRSLIISLDHRTPLMYLIDDERFFSSFENPLFLRFKKEVQKSIIKSISLKDDDNIVFLNLIPFDDIENKDEITLIIELIPLKPNLICTNKDKVLISSLYNDKNRNLEVGEVYQEPHQNGLSDDGEKITPKLLANHYENEINIRRLERYQSFLNFVNGKIKQANRKIKSINGDVEQANKNIELGEIADEILCFGLNLKSHISEIETSKGKIKLDESKSILENVNSFYKRVKKAKETISRSEQNVKNAQEEISYYQVLLDRFNQSNEKEADKIMQEIGMIKRKKEVKETPLNRPYRINKNGTIIYFGRNASQNDYLSFVMKLDREFTWLHIKDKSGAHLVICNQNPTEKELVLAAEISLLCSHSTSGEVIYTKKKNVRRGHTLGEAILKNYSLIKLNNVSSEAKAFLENAERVK